jgi:hypothetical protein
MPTKARGVTPTVHAQAREDILSPHAIGALSAGAVSAMSAVGAAVIKSTSMRWMKIRKGFGICSRSARLGPLASPSRLRTHLRRAVMQHSSKHMPRTCQS